MKLNISVELCQEDLEEILEAYNNCLENEDDHLTISDLEDRCDELQLELEAYAYEALLGLAENESAVFNILATIFEPVESDDDVVYLEDLDD